MRSYYVYITASNSRVLYIGVTSDLARRIYEHKQKLVRGFSKKYNVDQLVYYEIFNAPAIAVAREKQLKGWIRAKKIALIAATNPTWRDLIDTL